MLAKIGELLLNKTNNYKDTYNPQIRESKQVSGTQNIYIEKEQTEQIVQDRQYYKREVAERVIDKRKV